MSSVATATPFALHPDQLAALVRDLKGFPARYRDRGYRYLAAGRVLNVRIEAGTIEADIRGTSNYAAAWRWDASINEWDHDCTCDVSFECKHAFATACAALLLAPRPLCESAGVTAFVTQMPHVRIETPAEVEPPSPVRSDRMTAVDELRRESNHWRKRDLLQRILSRSPNRRMSAYDAPFPDMLEEADADLMCWLLAGEIARQAGGWVHPDLAPYAERPDLADRIKARARQQLLADLLVWATEPRTVTATRSLRFVWGFRSGYQSRLGLTIEARLTSTKLKDERRSLHQLQTLRSDAERSSGMLPPDQLAALESFLDSAQRYSFWNEDQRAPNEVIRALLEQAGDGGFLQWADELPPEAILRGGLTPGAPVLLGREPVRVLPACRGQDGSIAIELHCLWSNRSRPLGEVLHIARGANATRGVGFVIADGRIWIATEEPPEELLDEFRSAGTVRVPRDSWPQIVAPLANRFPHIREELASHTRIYDATPLIALALREDDWLQARLFAYTGETAWRPGQDWPEGMVLFEFSPPGHWRKYEAAEELAAPTSSYTQVGVAPSGDGAVDSTPEVSAEEESPAATPTPTAIAQSEIWAEAPDPQATQPALEWVASITNGTTMLGGRPPASDIADPPDITTGWWTRANRKRMEHFAIKWDERPRSVSYVGNERIRRLLSGSEGLRPRVRVTNTGIDWFSVKAEWEAEGLQLSEEDLARLRAANTRFVKLSSGWVRKEEADEQDETASLLAELGIEIGAGEQRLSMWELAHVSQRSVDAISSLGVDRDTYAALEKIREAVHAYSGTPPVAVPPGFCGELRPYQQRGLDFLAYVTQLGLGAILADDMGLGKTLQALVWLLHVRERNPRGGPALVICPTSVMHNWAREAANFTPELRVLSLGSGAERHELRKDIKKYDLVITNYALLRRDIDAWREVKLRAVIMDEAQYIKNPDAAVTRAAIELQAKHRLALTGTPLENRPLDLWSIMSFVNPGYLGSRAEFRGRFDRLDAPAHSRALLGAKLRPVLLRRMKKEVAPDLPDRIEERRDCEMTEGQRQLYLAELRRSRQLVDELSAEPGGVAQNKIEILAALTRLRQICCHPALGGGEPTLGSGKFEAVFELIESLIAEGHKVLLFSQFVQCLKLLEKEIKARGIGYHMLTGQSTKREQIVRNFQEDPDPSVFLISLKAGGTGLNLTAASYVIVFDPWWNPAVEAQAIDRTHRIGQDRTVIAYRLIATGTIEEKIWQLQNQKAAMVRDVLGEDGFARTLTRDDLRFLLDEDGLESVEA